MKRKRKLPFDPKAFLTKVNGGRAISHYQKDQIVYTQGEANHSENQPRDTGGDDRHDAISREFFHEEISGIGSYTKSR